MKQFLKIQVNFFLEGEKIGDSIKLGVIRSLSEFLKVFDKDRRENLLEIVLSVQKE